VNIDNIKNKWKKEKLNKEPKSEGSTMVEVLVGFSILMILLAGLTGVIHVSSTMLFDTRDMLEERKLFQEQFYRTEHGELNKTEIPAVRFSLKETDSTGKNAKTDGAEILLNHARAEKVSDENGLTVYQIYYK
jgi:competence protein ComGF